MSRVLPQMPAPALTVESLDGCDWSLDGRRPKTFTMIVFYRGHHCPVCRGYLKDLNGQLADFKERGVDVVAISGDTKERATQSRDEWELDGLAIGYGLPPAAMRDWGLFASRGIDDDEPELFSEPGLFLIDPDGVVFYEALNSMPFGRPSMQEMLGGVDFVTGKDYPARGEVGL